LPRRCRHLRREQVEKYGHTPEADRAQPFEPFAARLLGQTLKADVTAIREGAQFNQDRAIQRKRLLRVAAMAIAMIDWIDAEAADQT
jgi:hypothetical protein